MDRIPVYERIKREIKGRIDRQELPEGAEIASEHELSEQFAVSRNLTRQALRELELEGYLVRSRGRRSVVAPASHRSKGLPFDGSTTVAIAVQDQHCLHTSTVVDGFVNRLAEAKFQSVTYNMQFDCQDEERFVEHLPATNVAGLCLWLQYDQEATRALLRRHQEAGFPVVLVDRHLEGMDMDFVVSDNEWMGYTLTRALLERGHTRIGFATDGDNVASGLDRFKGYRRALEEAGLPFGEQRCGVFSSGRDTCQDSARRIMSFREAPTAFCCIHDSSAERLSRQLAALGYSVPEDIELAAVDDEGVPESQGIPMITVRQPAREMGRQAAELLLARIAEPRGVPEQRFLREEEVVKEPVSA